MSWLENYLRERHQNVFINNSSSDIGMIWEDVPQGSILGPLLFLIYINDLADELQSTTRLFADDTTLIKSSSSCRELETDLHRDLDKSNRWAKRGLFLLILIKLR